MRSSTHLIVAALSALGLTFTAGCQGLVESTTLDDEERAADAAGGEGDTSTGGGGEDAGGGGGDEDAGGVTRDTGGGGGEPDAAEPDVGEADPCEGVSCGANSACAPATGQCVCDSGYVEDAAGGCVEPDPCAGVSCGANSTCLPSTAACVCDEGFVLEAGGCEAPAPGDPRARTAQQVCARWNQDYPKQSTSVFTSNGNTCDAGQIEPDAHADAMRLVNLHRWLLGLDAAGVDWANQAKAQEAALMMHVNSSLSHSPPSSWQCFTQDGADAAGSSNLGLGYTHPSDTINGYMADSRTPSLGHRRWIISPTLDKVGFGHHGRGGAMWVFGKNNANVVPEYVMYPGAGIAPAESILGDWSISSNTNIGTPTITIAPRDGGAALPLGVTKIANNYGMRYAVSIQLGEQPMVGVPYVVTITLADGTVWSHETTVVDCDAI